MELKIIYRDENVLVIDKPAGQIVYPTLINLAVEKYPELKQAGKRPRYGLVHRLDKDTSGCILIAKNNKTLDFLQKQFKTGKVAKEYTALAVGKLQNKEGIIETLIGRAGKERKKQKAYLPFEPEASKIGLRKAITEYNVIEQFKDYALLAVRIKTGRKHQIRCHLAYLGFPIAGDKVYNFKNQICPKELKRQFLHANRLKIKLPDGKEKEFKSKLPKELKQVLKNLIK